MRKSVFVLVAKNLYVNKNQYIAVDNSSGGYPYTVDDLFSANVWSSKEVAENYANKFYESYLVLEIKSFNVITYDPTNPEEIRKRALEKLTESEKKALGLIGEITK